MSLSPTFSVAGASAPLALPGAGRLIRRARRHGNCVAVVTARPDYNVPNADDAVQHVQGIYEKIRFGRAYAQTVSSIEADSGISDERRASCSIPQPLDQLCSGRLWRLQNRSERTRVKN